MTLSSFKHRSKTTFVLAFLVAYAAAFFVLGTVFAYSKNFPSFMKVKGASTKSNFAQPVESPLPYSDTQSSSIISSTVKLCSNTKYSFQIAYPNNWFTTYNLDDQQCTFFAPYSFTIPQVTDDFFVPIKVEVVSPDNWQGTVKFYENPNDLQNIVSAQDIEINGASVEKIKAVTTGTDVSDKGLTKLTYLYYNSNVPLVLTYQQDPKDTSTDGEKILEDMAKSVKFY